MIKEKATATMEEKKMMVKEKKKKETTKKEQKRRRRKRKKKGDFLKNLKEGWASEKKKKTPTSMFGLV
jgi:hypothetical protein